MPEYFHSHPPPNTSDAPVGQGYRYTDDTEFITSSNAYRQHLWNVLLLTLSFIVCSICMGIYHGQVEGASVPVYYKKLMSVIMTISLKS
ncbi:hypothetical protein L211DRAFT_84624 [Terfezia boudieri ATCC MYA-4762]|uniref:Uncharacterized protein n=1 Tax=Terfezia boudieri ATCC MYA-4762 TaxID=1051890 RepID=A0A3N4M5L2_9PEZI|nr:hypothetical protein L211DRAFT_84624 [Terfezia boudieri ATCC MYA-4762]